MSLLAPAFLAGLAAVTVPVLVHLTQRHRKDALRFPSLMFVRRVPYRVTRRRRIRNWFILLLRIGAVTLLVAAFSRPLLDRAGAVATLAGAREVVIILDRSYSMGYGNRWSRALDAARRTIDELGAEDRATLLVFDERAEAVTQATSDAAELRGALEHIEIGHGVGRYAPVMQLAREILQRSDRPRGEAVLISDFQAVGWDAGRVVRLPERTHLGTVDVAEAHAANIAVTGLSLARGRSGDRQTLTVTARVANFGDREHEDLRASLELDGEVVQSVSADIESGATTRVVFEPVMLLSRTQTAAVRAGDDPLPGDNVFHFTAASDPPVRVLILEPRGAPASHDLYLTRALSIGHQPEFVVSGSSVATLRPSDLEGVNVVILNDAPYPLGAAGRNLDELVERGAGLLVVLGSRTPPTAWTDDGRSILPASFGDPVDRTAGSRLGYIDFDHAALRPFREPHSGDFTAARFFRFRRLEAQEGSTVLARFDDGIPALVEGRRGDGRVIVLASGVANFWNDLVLQPVFLPFLHQLAKHLAAYREPEGWAEVGSVVDLAQISPLWAPAAARGAELVVEEPGGAREVIRPAEDASLLQVERAGYYELRSLGDDEARFTLAANRNPAESDLSRVDPQEVAAALAAPEAGSESEAASLVLTSEDRERRQGLWWYLLAGAGALLLLEMLLANRESRGTPPRVVREKARTGR
jgi:hypothetical protein